MAPVCRVDLPFRKYEGGIHRGKDISENASLQWERYLRNDVIQTMPQTRCRGKDTPENITRKRCLGKVTSEKIAQKK